MGWDQDNKKLFGRSIVPSISTLHLRCELFSASDSFQRSHKLKYP